MNRLWFHPRLSRLLHFTRRYSNGGTVTSQHRRRFLATLVASGSAIYIFNYLNESYANLKSKVDAFTAPFQYITEAIRSLSFFSSLPYDPDDLLDKSPLYYPHNDFIRKILDIRRELIDIGLDSSEIPVPTIVVVGAQSSGKSSVLEKIIGHRGDNMTTRRPIEIYLTNDKTAQSDYAVVYDPLSKSQVRFHEFTQLKSHIDSLNLKVANFVSSDPIIVNFHSPRLPDLCFVDLPGFIQISSKDQPGDLKDRIVKICSKYLKFPNIILAISPADVDLANSEAIRASRETDPSGSRTIGVISKIDLVTPSMLQSILRNDLYPLELGYVGVSCEEIRHSSALDSSLTGFGSLIDKLNISMEKIMRASLPGLLDFANRQHEELEYLIKSRFDTTVKYRSFIYVNDVLNRMRSYLYETSEYLKGEALAQSFMSILYFKLLQFKEISELYGDTISYSSFFRSGISKDLVSFSLQHFFNVLKNKVLHDPILSGHSNATNHFISKAAEECKGNVPVIVDFVEDIFRPFKRKTDPIKLETHSHALPLYICKEYYQRLFEEYKQVCQTLPHLTAIKIIRRLREGISVSEKGRGLALDLVRLHTRLELIKNYTAGLKRPSGSSNADLSALFKLLSARIIPIIEQNLFEHTINGVGEVLLLTNSEKGYQTPKFLPDFNTIVSENPLIFEEYLLREKESHLKNVIFKLSSIQAHQ